MSTSLIFPNSLFHIRSRSFVFFLSLILLLSISSDLQAASRGKPEGATVRGKDVIDKSIRKGLKNKVNSEMTDLATSLNINPKELREFVIQERAGTQQSKKAWAELFARVQQNKEPVSIQSLSSYLKIRTSKIVDNLSVRETDLLAIQKNWTIRQQENFSLVLNKAAEIAHSGKEVTMEAAYQRALKDLGYSKKAKSCKL